MLVFLSIWLCVGAMEPIFRYHTLPLNWEEAQKHCRMQHTDLVTIRNPRENTKITDGWLGLSRKSNDAGWTWSVGNNSGIKPIPWEKIPQSNEHCVYKREGNWLPEDCSKAHSFCCADEPVILVKERKTWEEALEHCESLQKKNALYELAILPTTEDQRKALSFVQPIDRYRLWIGLKFLGDQWMWLNGTKITNEIVNMCPLPHSCATLLTKAEESLINITNCEHKTFFLCSMKPRN